MRRRVSEQGHGARTGPSDNGRMEISGRTVVLTGATSGIGRATAAALAAEAGTLVVHGPEPHDDVRPVLHEFRSAMSPGASLIYLPADYSDLTNVVALAEGIRRETTHVDVLVNNAARPGAPRWTSTPDGHETTLQINYLAPVLLTTLLQDLIGAHGPGRIVNVTSATHLAASLHLDDLDLARQAYTAAGAYAHSKLALVTETCRLAGTLRGNGTEAVSVHPGVIRTRLLHAMFSISGDSPAQAAQTMLKVIGRDGDNGTYYDERRPAPPNPLAERPDVQQRLGELTTAALAPWLGQP